MSILRGDFAPDQVAAIEDAMERTGLPFASAVRMLIDYGVNARRGHRIATESLPEETSKEDGEGETQESQDPTVIETERKGSGENGESVLVPAKAKRTRTQVQAPLIPDPPAEIDSPELRIFLPEFAEYRRKIKKSPLSPSGWSLLFNRLKPAGRGHAVLALRYSISNGWKSFDVEWLKGKSWATVASELGLSLEAEKPAPSPADFAARNLARAIEDARKEIPKLAPAEDGWTSYSRSIFFDHLNTCESEAEVADHLARSRALCDRLRALGAFPLRRATQVGEILPAGGGGPLAVDLRGAFICDSTCPVCGEDQNQGPCSCGDQSEPAVSGPFVPVFFPSPICGCGCEMVEFDDGHACPVCERDFLADKEFEGRPALALVGMCDEADDFEPRQLYPGHPDWNTYQADMQKRAEPMLDAAIAEINKGGADLAPSHCPRCGRPSHFRYTSDEEAAKQSSLCWGESTAECDRLARLKDEVAENEREVCPHGTPYCYPCEDCDAETAGITGYPNTTPLSSAVVGALLGADDAAAIRGGAAELTTRITTQDARGKATIRWR